MDQETNSYVTNVFGYYSIPYNDFRTHLFLSLQIFNTHGIPTCIFKHAEPSPSTLYDSRTPCAKILDENHHNKNLCHAFDRFCYYVEDPELETEDWKLKQELVRFARHLLCEEHRQEITQMLLCDLAEKVTACRKRFLLRARRGGYGSISGRKEGTGGHHHRQKSRISSLFMTQRKSGEQQEFEQRGDRSVSPSSRSSGDEGYSVVKRSVSEKQAIRPISSSPDMQGLQSPRHASTDLTFRDSLSKERHSVGRASALMTKLSPAQKSRWEVD